MNDDLELSLLALGAALEVPPVHDLAGALVLPPRRRGRGRGLRLSRRALAAAAALTLLAGGTAMAVPASRNEVLTVLGLRGARLERVPALPTIGRRQRARLDLGRRIPLDAARAAVNFTPLLPPHVDTAYLAHDVPGGRLSLIVGTELITELRGSSQPYFLKLLDPQTRARRLRIAGSPGVYLSGGVHAVLFAARNGSVRSEAIRLAGNVLLWQRGALTIRIEGARSLPEALALARSLH